MTPELYREVESYLRSLDDAGLRRILYLESSGYEPEALGIAYAEAHRRGMQDHTLKEYAERFPAEWLEHVGFCFRCWMETTDESPGLLLMVFGIGTMIHHSRDPCPDCESLVARKWFCIFWIPVVPLSWYRVRLKHRIHAGTFGLAGRRFKQAP